MTTSFLSQIQVNGTEAEKFLQGQLTCDMNEVDSSPRLGGHCNAKGRVISLFQICRTNQGFSLTLPTDLAIIAFTHLQTYARLFRACALTLDNPDQPVDLLTWQLNTIRQGQPVLYAATSGLFLPHDLNLIQLGGASLSKGCYTGQEIVARMHYLGKPKRQLYYLWLKTKQTVTPAPGAEIQMAEQSEKPIGHLVNAVKHEDKIEAMAVLTTRSYPSTPSLMLMIDYQPYMALNVRAYTT